MLTTMGGDDWPWIAALAPLGGALAWFAKAMREQGRADEYERNATATIDAKNSENQLLRGTIVRLEERLDAKDDTIAQLRAELAAARESRRRP